MAALSPQIKHAAGSYPRPSGVFLPVII